MAVESPLCYRFRMAIQVALLRAVNVGGRNLVMTELKAMFESLAFGQVRTILQSGNIVFGSGARTGAALESFLEAETERQFRLRTHYFVRTADEWNAIIEENPFRREAKDDPSHLLVLPLKAAPAGSDVAALRAAIRGREIIHSSGRHLYAYYPDGIGESKLTVSLIERKLRTCSTGRNWNTVLKIQAAAAN
ncbi:MAG: DUF1697 domain-containing protein [Terriglobia bacterium]